ncbi:25690_t:CDS:2, partial [Dentiscutata erythropus]
EESEYESSSDDEYENKELEDRDWYPRALDTYINAPTDLTPP